MAIAGQLHALLAAVGETRPVILMGHSIAGLYPRAYAARYPRNLAGLVFVDGGAPLQDDRVPAAGRDPGRAAAEPVVDQDARAVRLVSHDRGALFHLDSSIRAVGSQGRAVASTLIGSAREHLGELDLQLIEVELTLAGVNPEMASLKDIGAANLKRAHAAARQTGEELAKRLTTASEPVSMRA